MKILNSLTLLASLLSTSTAIDTTKYPKSITLTYEFIGNSKEPAKQLAQVLYDPTTLKHHLASWTPPSTDSLKSTTQEPTSTQLLRILLPDGSSTVSSLSAFDPSLSQHINLWLSQSPQNPTIFSASISSISPPPLSDEEIRQKRKEERARAKGKPIPVAKPKPKASKPKTKKGVVVPVKKEQEEGGPVVRVNLLVAGEGPKPRLLSRKAPVMDADGKEVQQEEVVEKSFFQKYWWVFLAGMMLVTMGGGGGEK